MFGSNPTGSASVLGNTDNTVYSNKLSGHRKVWGRSNFPYFLKIIKNPRTACPIKKIACCL